jgi:nucleotide-binding universal stress UspA family protein
MYRTIVVTLDGSEASRVALPYAEVIAHAAGAAIELVHVNVPWLRQGDADESAITSVEPYEEAHSMAAEPGWLEAAARALSRRTKTAVSASELEGPVVATLRHHIEQTAPDLLIMATRGQGAGGPTWIGSVADAFAQRATLPLLLVPFQSGNRRHHGKPVLRRLLILLDGSRASEQILEPALRLARTLQAKVRLLLVVAPPVPPASGESARDNAGAYLAAIAASISGLPTPAELSVVEHGNPATAILEEVRDNRMDCIAAASHGESGISRMLSGGPAEKRFEGVSVPLFLFRTVE